MRRAPCGMGKAALTAAFALTLLLPFSHGCTRSSDDRQAIEKVVITRQQAERIAKGAGLDDAAIQTLFAEAEALAQRLAGL